MAHRHHHLEIGTSQAFGLGIALNVGFVVVEVAAGLATGSMALLSDAGHNVGDILALLLAWAGYRLAQTKPSERRTYGMKRATVMASLSSAVLLCLALGAVAWEAIARLNEPAQVNGAVVVVVAGIGVLINGATAALFLAGRKRDLNIKAAFLHMVADAVISLGVVCAGVCIVFTGWMWVDPVVALIVALFVLASGFGLLRESLDLAMDAVPRHIDVDAIRQYLSSVPGVAGVHDLHIWAMSTTETALTAHLVVPAREVDDGFLRSVTETLKGRFAIHHPTIQVEKGTTGAPCATFDAQCS